MVAATTLACTMMATIAPIASIKAYGSNTGGGLLLSRGRPLCPQPRFSIYTSQIANEISFLVSLVVYVPLLINLTSRTITFYLFSEPLRLRFLTPMFIISYILFTKYIIHTTYHTVSCNISHIFVYQNAQWMHDLDPCPSSPRYLYT